jgi:hypothetical protein
MNYFWSTLGYSDYSQIPFQTQLKVEVMGRRINTNSFSFQFDNSNSFNIVSVQRKENSIDEYKFELEINPQSKLGEWLISFGKFEWRRIDDFRTMYIKWQNNKEELLYLYQNKKPFDCKVKAMTGSSSKIVESYTDDEHSEYAVLIRQQEKQ